VSEAAVPYPTLLVTVSAAHVAQLLLGPRMCRLPVDQRSVVACLHAVGRQYVSRVLLCDSHGGTAEREQAVV
jgi:hypothetical protein